MNWTRDYASFYEDVNDMSAVELLDRLPAPLATHVVRVAKDD